MRQSRLELGAVGALAAFGLNVFGNQCPPAAIQVGRDSFPLRLKPKTAATLLVSRISRRYRLVDVGCRDIYCASADLRLELEHRSAHVRTKIGDKPNSSFVVLFVFLKHIARIFAGIIIN